MIDLSNWQLGDCAEITMDAMILPDAELLALADRCEALLLERADGAGITELKAMNHSACRRRPREPIP